MLGYFSSYVKIDPYVKWCGGHTSKHSSVAKSLNRLKKRETYYV